jgi:hypothetical protein
MLVTGSVVSASTAFRIGAGWLGLVSRRTPPLLRLAAESTAGRNHPDRAQAEFRDRLIGLARESAEISWRELRRGIDDLDEFTRPQEQHEASPGDPGANGSAPRQIRPYRVKR